MNLITNPLSITNPDTGVILHLGSVDFGTVAVIEHPMLTGGIMAEHDGSTWGEVTAVVLDESTGQWSDALPMPDEVRAKMLADSDFENGIARMADALDEQAAVQFLIQLIGPDALSGL